MPPAPPNEDDPPPQPPVQPELEDCCHSGCTPCVFDLYDDALARYRSALAAWEQRQAERRLAEATRQPEAARQPQAERQAEAKPGAKTPHRTSPSRR
ncbi:oxidoreductase-like domain-containing protein [Paraburkholderia sp. MMS20-SJTR3]|uniref:Oxidoreductase-like domain-containing protein n=1 Tax=Paraburkholderia sejongensis TaxID=2886946 RepID=A0ABS8JY03_9BURK|nr:oxidoreductase-like domain-containing protein [Paraburkholderia sp. MMS20-SJTR3]